MPLLIKCRLSSDISKCGKHDLAEQPITWYSRSHDSFVKQVKICEAITQRDSDSEHAVSSLHRASLRNWSRQNRHWELDAKADGDIR